MAFAPCLVQRQASGLADTPRSWLRGHGVHGLWLSRTAAVLTSPGCFGEVTGGVGRRGREL
jgi:hypothetical protein